jgi:hypothetical protein
MVNEALRKVPFFETREEKTKPPGRVRAALLEV